MPDGPVSDARPNAGVATWLFAFGRSLLDLLYPPRCAGCGRVGFLFCDACHSQIALIPAAVCRQCGRPTPEHNPGRANERLLCAACRCSDSSLDGIIAVAFFADPLRAAIHHLKYRNGRRVAQPLGERMAETWLALGPTVDAILPVPLHASRTAKRGYNQSALLASVLSQEIGLPMEERLLKRERATQPQVGLGLHERQHNVDGAFQCNVDLTGKRFVLIDDVCTTGATLEACAQVLRTAGAERVWGFTLARAGWRSDSQPS